MIHNEQHTTLNPQFEDTIVTGTLLIYNNDAIKEKHTICFSHWPLMWQVHRDIFWPSLTK